jgi:hypothetical protein
LCVQAQDARELGHQRRSFRLHRRVGNLRTAQDVNKKSTDAVNNAAGSAFQYLLPALLIRPYIGQTILCEVMSKRNLELSQALQVIPNRLCVRPIGVTVQVL